MVLLLIAALLQDPDPRRVDELVKQFRGDDISLRDAAAKALIEMGEKVLPLLEKHEKSDDAEVRSRVAQVAFKLRPWRIAPVAETVKAALKAGSKPEDWRGSIKAHIEKLLEELGDDIAAESKRDALKAVAKCFEEKMEILRENADDAKGAVYLVVNAKATDVDRGAMVVCEAANLGKVDDSIVICTGDVVIDDKLEQSIVIAGGKVTVGGEVKNSIVVCSGAFAVGDDLRDTTVIAAGGCSVGTDSKECVFVNTKAAVGGKASKDRSVSKPRLPAAKE